MVAPENRPLETEIPIGNPPFSGATFVSGVQANPPLPAVSEAKPQTNCPIESTFNSTS